MDVSKMLGKSLSFTNVYVVYVKYYGFHELNLLLMMGFNTSMDVSFIGDAPSQR
jgi:hypothetical protein